MSAPCLQMEQIVRAALLEDIGPGDLTTNACIPPDRMARGSSWPNRRGCSRA